MPVTVFHGPFHQPVVPMDLCSCRHALLHRGGFAHCFNLPGQPCSRPCPGFAGDRVGLIHQRACHLPQVVDLLPHPSPDPDLFGICAAGLAGILGLLRCSPGYSQYASDAEPQSRDWSRLDWRQCFDYVAANGGTLRNIPGNGPWR